MNQKQALAKYKELKKEYGKSLNKIYRFRKNYPFGKNSTAVYTIVKK